MRYKLFGPSGLRVSEVALGTVNFGAKMGDWTLELPEARTIFDAYVEAGGNFFDCADSYVRTRSEEILGELIHDERDRFVVASKYGEPRVEPRVVMTGSSRRNMRISLENSLRRLKTDYVDIFYLHWWDFSTSWEEILSGMDDLVRSGKVQYVGVSNVPAWEVSRGMTIAEMRGWEPLVAIQLMYNLAERSAEREYFPMALELGLAMTAYNPVASGVLAGLHGDAEFIPRGNRALPKAKALAPTVQRIAKELSISPIQLAHAWNHQQGDRFGGQLFPIMGADSPAQVAENLAAFDLVLPSEAFDEIEQLTAPELNYPYERLLMRMSKSAQMDKNGHAFPNHGRRDPRFGFS